ncbi:THO complex subunit 1 transcription elongation factor-domain-containing protein [Rhodotorula diobovata]|uniref:THO complex subunit 1 transcription elongation factor-domain-containing protein n=1 Tax=Rhodotorula diobovata TaxID=5288 RepID=A0A5C5G605_9BASI|nr:THO complex subunit 1 transcription elongation factor-domain-containing protein [Rhodotorula diobovata]
MADPGADLSSSLTPLSSATPLSPAALVAPTLATAAPSTSSAQSTYAAFRDSVRTDLRALAQSLKTRRDNGEPATGHELKDAVDNALRHAGATRRSETGDRPRWEVDAWQATLERTLEELVHEAAVPTTDAAAFAHLQDLLDVVLCAYEADFVDESFPLTTLEALMELRPITACEPLLGYIESRAERLTTGMEYTRGRGPILLRLLNDLLRRLPRSQSEPVILSGRILLLLSAVYPLGEKSGVNLRGNFNLGKGTVWEQEVAKKEMEGAKEDAKKEEEEGEGQGKPKEGEDAKMAEVEEGEEAEPGQPNGADNGTSSGFYAAFWSLQRFFNNPHLLFAPAPPASSSSSSSSSPLSELHAGVRKTLAAFDAATKKEKELAGAAKGESAGSAKAGGEDTAGEEQLEEYFFPKFLTSRNLLDLELSDPSFRRQILVQLLILFQYLLSLTPTARKRTDALPVTNQPALSSHVLGAEAEQWVRELRSRTLDEMDAMEGGRRFRKAVMVVLTREQNWTDWKLRSCYPFTKPALPTAEASVTARARQKALARKPKRFPYKLGNPRLDRLWRHNTTSLEGFEPSVGADDLSSLLAPTGAYSQSRALLTRLRAAGPSAPSAPASLAAAEAAHDAAQWRAVRAAASSELRFFARIGAGDVELLRGLVEEERRERGDAEEGDGDEGKKEDKEEEAEGYDSDDSVLGLRPPKVREPEAGTPEPPLRAKGESEGGGGGGGAGDDVKMDADDAAGTPPPPPADAPATTPGTPKRPREEEEEDGDVGMGDAEGEGPGSKRARTE